MAVKVITPPTIYPVSVADAKAHCHVTHALEDDLFGAIIAAATDRCEQMTGRALVAQTLELSLDEFPARISLPRPPLQSVTSVKYIDVDGAEQTLSSSFYAVHNDSDAAPAYIAPAFETVWPSTRSVPGAVKVRYVAGWPTVPGSPATATTPLAIRQWILCRASGLYLQRESFVVGQQVFEMPHDFVDGLLDRYAVREFV